MNSKDLWVAVIIGSVREGRFGQEVGAWVDKQLTGQHATDLVELADFSFPAAMSAHQDVSAFAEKIDKADAIVVITPEYNHSFPGPLKTAIDAAGSGWQAKPVGFVSYGGMSGGLRAVEALRPVFAELHAVTARETVSLHNPWVPTADPEIDYPDAEATEALAKMMRQLHWWAAALSTARTPYPV